MPEPLLLYSTNTRLAFTISEAFYGHRHYVWCNPYFNADSAPKLQVDMPPSSTPYDLFRTYESDITRGDHHSDSVKRNRAGILRDISSKRKAKAITKNQFEEAQSIVAAATLEHFRPLLYVIPFRGVAKWARSVPPVERAALFSQEFIIEELPRSSFDVLWW